MIVLFLKGFCRLFAALPLSLALSVGRALGLGFGFLVPRNRRRALEGLSRSYPDRSERELRGIMWAMFRNLGMNTVEMLRWMGGREQELSARIDVQGEDHLQAAMSQGRGVAVLTAHIGNWDLMGLWAASRFPLTIISKVIKHEALNRYWMEKRAQARVRILPAHGSYRQCLRVLKAGECLGFILDQNMTRSEGIFVEFFGRSACTTPGLAMLAAHGAAPVLPVFMYRRADGGHSVRIHPPVPPPADRKPESIAAATQHYTRIVEAAISAAPEQWIWLHRRWRTQPLPQNERAAHADVEGQQSGRSS